MRFVLRMGVPEMEALWNDLSSRKLSGALDADQQKLFKKLVKALAYLQENPLHNSLRSHEIEPMTRKAGFKVFQSYLENNTPAAGRLFWAYGPARGEITILGIEPHPEDAKRGAYERVRLSAMPKPRKRS